MDGWAWLDCVSVCVFWIFFCCGVNKEGKEEWGGGEGNFEDYL